MSKRLDLEGKTIGDIKVHRFSHAQKSQALWWAICPKCECGFLISSCNLMNQTPKGCQRCYISEMKKLSDSEENNIIVLYNHMIPIDQIAERYDIGRETVYDILKRHSVKANRKLTESERHMIFHYRRIGVPWSHLCELFDRQPDSLRKVIQRLKEKGYNE